MAENPQCAKCTKTVCDSEAFLKGPENCPTKTRQGIIKEAMGELAKISEDLFILWLLQVHDELLAEIPKRALDTAVPVIKCIMENSVPLSVPLVVEPKVSEKSWGEMSVYKEKR